MAIIKKVHFVGSTVLIYYDAGQQNIDLELYTSPEILWLSEELLCSRRGFCSQQLVRVGNVFTTSSVINTLHCNSLLAHTQFTTVLYYLKRRKVYWTVI
jgi:hypothetical protein